jgi:transposase
MGRLIAILDSHWMESMSSRSPLSATNDQKSALAELAGSELRGEADRGRAILLTLAGWTGPEIAEAFGVTADSVRHWRQWFAEGGVEALRSTLAPGPSAAKGERALEVASAVLREPVENRTNWTLPRLCAEVERQTGTRISRSRLSVLLRQKGGSAGAVRDTR